MEFLYIVWDADPVAFEIFGRGVRWYGILLAVGFFLGYLIVSALMRKEGQKQERIDILAIYVVVGVVVGLRLGHCLFYNPVYYLSNPLEILKVWEGGLASHGGAVGILLAVWLYSRKYKMNYLGLLDRIALIVPLAGGLVRFGNLFNSEIFGVQTSVPWAFKFLRNRPDLIPAIESAQGKCDIQNLDCLIQYWPARHPTQLYEGIFYLIMFIVFYFIFMKFKSRWKEGVFLGWFLIVLFVFRYLIEFTKVEQVEFEGWTAAIKMGQLLSVPFVLLGLYFLGRGFGWFKRKQNP
ncbi:MAG: prolipoprotein diacylglyceryl transferase [Bacteroidales bacterium]|jgi:prolipoprotein diacylglyceryl transferase|nr:prolipoprotein diacylglyceryl transferase [Bacteroidales bacterium]HOL98296.1 prolipoprotein diacylglyceryl transferase [Bacteroidales bacterium]HOM36636.1 prolipoprotein diacylglyceryl transferase [Bacteroidales bacterium]HPD24071.1 prolipoprotein diacylglyceryl transferase [Bacteroidales bacterium]HRT00064.1 prolipoprotein diacylglyceryl transferase [Bacteroidales bacterium]